MIFLITIVLANSEIEEMDQSLFQKVWQNSYGLNLYHTQRNDNLSKQIESTNKPTKLYPISMGSWQNNKILDGMSIFDT
jgi:hypothetical protein